MNDYRILNLKSKEKLNKSNFQTTILPQLKTSFFEAFIKITNKNYKLLENPLLKSLLTKRVKGEIF